MRTWLLPEYVEDVLPPSAWAMEYLRRRLLDLFHAHGYDLIVPPLLEFLPSLLTGSGHDMDLQTFKVVDQITGRLMGLRADITPQAARIDAQVLNREGVTRLCYASSILHALPNGITRNREPLQIGAELYGHEGIESDVEIQRLMLRALKLAGVEQPHLDLGHVAVFQTLAERGSLSEEQESELFQALQGKDIPTIRDLTRDLEASTRDALLALPEFYGGAEVLDAAEKRLPRHPAIKHALDDLRAIGLALKDEAGSLRFDLAELRGYHYHSGVVFAAYTQDRASAIALGGRYDEVGSQFGRARPATGFSMDLRVLNALSPVGGMASGILAPYTPDPQLLAQVEGLRAQGERVVVDLPGHDACRAELNCDRMLVKRDGTWVVEKVENQ
jgi:ATP phosphoribosyltransferase regulatory subunit